MLSSVSRPNVILLEGASSVDSFRKFFFFSQFACIFYEMSTLDHGSQNCGEDLTREE